MKERRCGSMLILVACFFYQCGSQGEPEQRPPIDAGQDSSGPTTTDGPTTTGKDYELAVSWDGIADGRIFQRDTDQTYSLVVEGTFADEPPRIEAKVVTADQGQEVVSWTEIATAPTGGRFTGTLPGIPQGGWYQLQIRADDDNVTDYRGTNRFAVGILLACLGQSHIDGWFDPEFGEPDEPGDDRVRMYRHAQVRQAGPEWAGWQPVTGLAATVFGNEVSRALDVPVGLLDYGVQGASLWQANSLLPLFGWWLADDSGNQPSVDNYAVFLRGFEEVGPRVEAALWIQGHTDAMKGESKEHYLEGLGQFLTSLREDTNSPDLPVFFSLVARQGDSYGMGTITPDEDIQAIRDAERQYIEQDPNAHLGCTTMDLPIDHTNVHHAPAGQRMQAQRMALAVASVLGTSASAGYRGPKLTGYRAVGANTLEITLQHEGGDDFSPAEGIQGFRVEGDDVGQINGVTRHSPTAIRIELSGDASSVSYVDYLYGGNPGDLDIHIYVESYVHDNTTHKLPLEGGLVPALR